MRKDNGKENATVENWVFDTSAVLTLVLDEPGADTVTSLTTSTTNLIYVSFITNYEVHYKFLRNFGESSADNVLKLLLSQRWITDYDVDLAMIKVASSFKAQYRISVADSWIAALAFNRHATLVHKDPEFEALKDQIDLLSLPYK
ncbi:MAG: PIN domain-containing protein [Candidatus Marinimicrobia bacterium]|nr:PIN domain-containing protein [Candidatus Neomarinimicrobiota bacterium]